MEKVLPNKVDSNNEEYTITSLLVKDGDYVTAGTIVGVGETTKVTFDVEAPVAGYILFQSLPGASLRFEQPFAYIFQSIEEQESYCLELQSANKKLVAVGVKRNITRRASELAEKYGIDLSVIPLGTLVTEKLVLSLLPKDADKLIVSEEISRHRTDKQANRPRLLIIGSGMGASQILDILDDSSFQPVGFIDDDPTKIGTNVLDLHVLGNVASLDMLHSDNFFDEAIVSVSTSIQFRAKTYELLTKRKIKLANIIDKSVRISKTAVIGDGNVICFGCQIANNSIIGSNNFISSYNSFDHHNTIGSNISTGPGCMTSGLVAIGDQVRFGTGIFVEPYLKIGSRSIISSGSIIRTDVPEDSVIKIRVDHKSVKT